MINKSESIKELAAAQSQMPAVQMNAVNPFLKNKYADLGAIISTAQPILAKHGLSVSQLPTSEDDHVGVTTMLMHESGEWLSTEMSLSIGEEKGKSNAQVAGSIITYLRRYSLASMLGMYADEDGDGNAPKPQPAKPQAKPEPQPEPEQEQPQPTSAIEEGIVKLRRFAYNAGEANEKQRALLRHLIDDVVFQDDNAHHVLFQYLYQEPSIKAISGGAVRGLLDWLKAEKDASGEYQTARGKELHAVMRYIEKENGQLDLFESAGDPA